jgi:hypothetical protein
MLSRTNSCQSRWCVYISEKELGIFALPLSHSRPGELSSSGLRRLSNRAKGQDILEWRRPFLPKQRPIPVVLRPQLKVIEGPFVAGESRL